MISTSPLLLDYPGSNFEPGHRDLPANEETHIATARLPFPGGGVLQIPTRKLPRPSTTCRKQSGCAPVLWNQCRWPTGLHFDYSGQKQRIREIYEFYSAYLGIDFVESEASGMTIVVGDMFPSGQVSGGGTLGVATLNSLGGLAIMDGAQIWDNGLDSQFPGLRSFRRPCMKSGICLVLDMILNFLTARFSAAAALGRPLMESIQAIKTSFTDSFCIDRTIAIPICTDSSCPPMLRVKISLEIIAERAANSSNLDSHLTLFRESGGSSEVVTANNDYLSSDYFVRTSLKSRTYYVGVTASGNQDHNPLSNDSGGGGVVKGITSCNSSSSLMSSHRSSIPVALELDGDSDGRREPTSTSGCALLHRLILPRLNAQDGVCRQGLLWRSKPVRQFNLSTIFLLRLPLSGSVISCA